MRATLSPAFTSSKMRQMFEYVAECGGQMANYYSEKFEEMENSGKRNIYVFPVSKITANRILFVDKRILEIEMKDAFSRYTNDVIATSAFGIKVDSLKERENEFYLMGLQVSNTTALQFIKMLIILISPRLAKVNHLTFYKSH